MTIIVCFLFHHTIRRTIKTEERSVKNSDCSKYKFGGFKNIKTNFTEQDLQFYPTPKSLLDRITDSLKWDKITSVLEPSAGKGDIADYVKEKLNTPYTRYDIQIDCIEKDPALRKMLEGKEYHVIHDDFLTYHGQYHYDLIILNR